MDRRRPNDDTRRAGAGPRRPQWRAGAGWLARRLRSGARDERGAASIEFAIWAPFFLLITAFVAEIAFVFTVNASMWNASRDVVRRLAYHQIEASEARDEWLRNAMIPDAGYDVQVQEDVENVTLTVSLPVRNASLLGIVVSRFDGDLTVRLAMLREPV